MSSPSSHLPLGSAGNNNNNNNSKNNNNASSSSLRGVVGGREFKPYAMKLQRLYKTSIEKDAANVTFDEDGNMKSDLSAGGVLRRIGQKQLSSRKQRRRKQKLLKNKKRGRGKRGSSSGSSSSSSSDSSSSSVSSRNKDSDDYDSDDDDNNNEDDDDDSDDDDSDDESEDNNNNNNNNVDGEKKVTEPAAMHGLHKLIHRRRKARYEAGVKLLDMERTMLETEVDDGPDTSKVLEDVLRRQGGGLLHGLRSNRYGKNITDSDDENSNDNDDDDGDNKDDNNNNNQDGDLLLDNQNRASLSDFQRKNENNKNKRRNRRKKSRSPSGGRYEDDDYKKKKNYNDDDDDDDDNDYGEDEEDGVGGGGGRSPNSRSPKRIPSPNSSSSKSSSSYLPSIMRGVKVDFSKQAEEAAQAAQLLLDTKKSLGNDCRYMLQGALHSSNTSVKKYHALYTHGDLDVAAAFHSRPAPLPQLPDMAKSLGARARGRPPAHPPSITSSSSSSSSTSSTSPHNENNEEEQNNKSGENSSSPNATEENRQKAIQFLFMTECRTPKQNSLQVHIPRPPPIHNNNTKQNNNNNNPSSALASASSFTLDSSSQHPQQHQQQQQQREEEHENDPVIPLGKRVDSFSSPSSRSRLGAGTGAGAGSGVQFVGGAGTLDALFEVDNVCSPEQSPGFGAAFFNTPSSPPTHKIVSQQQQQQQQKKEAPTTDDNVNNLFPHSHNNASSNNKKKNKVSVEELLSFNQKRNIDRHCQDYRQLPVEEQPHLPHLKPGIGSARKMRVFIKGVDSSAVSHGRYGIVELKRAFEAQQEFREERKNIINRELGLKGQTFRAPQSILHNVRSKVKKVVAAKDHEERILFYLEHIENVRPYIDRLFPRVRGQHPRAMSGSGSDQLLQTTTTPTPMTTTTSTPTPVPTTLDASSSLHLQPSAESEMLAESSGNSKGQQQQQQQQQQRKEQEEGKLPIKRQNTEFFNSTNTANNNTNDIDDIVANYHRSRLAEKEREARSKLADSSTSLSLSTSSLPNNSNNNTSSSSTRNKKTTGVLSERQKQQLVFEERKKERRRKHRGSGSSDEYDAAHNFLDDLWATIQLENGLHGLNTLEKVFVREDESTFKKEDIHLEHVVNLLALVAPLTGASDEEFAAWIYRMRRHHNARDRAVVVEMAKCGFLSDDEKIDANFCLWVYNVKGTWNGITSTASKGKAFLRFRAEDKNQVTTPKVPLRSMHFGDDAVYNIFLSDHRVQILVELVLENGEGLADGYFTVEAVGWKRLTHREVHLSAGARGRGIVSIAIEMDFPKGISASVRRKFATQDAPSALPAGTSASIAAVAAAATAAANGDPTASSSPENQLFGGKKQKRANHHRHGHRHHHHQHHHHHPHPEKNDDTNESEGDENNTNKTPLTARVQEVKNQHGKISGTARR